MRARLHVAGGDRAAAPADAAASIRPAPRRPTPAAPVALVGGALGLALSSLLVPSSPSYDPFAWLVWGRELVDPAQTLALAGGPSWKPLPVLFAAPFSLAGGAAPALWLIVARAGLLLALAGGWALAVRLAGAWAGAPAAIALALLAGILSLALRGASEPLLLAAVLWGVERHLAGRRGQAFALGLAATLIRPEAFAFVLLYAAWRWRAASRRERVLLAAGIALVPLLWLGPPAMTGDALAPSHYATAYRGNTGSDPAWTALRRGLGLTLAPVWVLAGLAVALRPGDRALRGLALGAVAWLALVAAMTVAGYPGLARFMLPAAAVACVLAAVGAVELVRRSAAGRAARVPLVTVAALVAIAVAFGADSVATLGPQVREATRLGRMQRRLTTAIAAAGGRTAVLACGAVATNRSAQTALAWKLRVELDRVARRLGTAGIVFRGPRSQELGSPPRVAIPHARRRVVARAGVWQVLAFSARATPLPRRCSAAAASPPAAPPAGRTTRSMIRR